MIKLFTDGGWSMWFILLFGFVALATAGWFSMRPSKTQIGFIKWMGTATLFSILAGFCSDMGTVLFAVVKIEDTNLRGQVICEGFAESMSPGIMGFVILSLVALLTAVGRRRLDARDS
jgi:hypothetical protein